MNAYARLQPRCACGGAAAGRCAACARRNIPGPQPKLAVSTPGDRWEREADQAADQVLAAGGRPQLSRLASRPLQREGEDEKKKPPPSPVTEGLSTVASNLGENNPAFSKFTERLGDRFMAQPAPLSIGVPVFLGANYAFLWTMALADPAMRRQFDDFNLALLPGIVPQFPVKTFKYQILDGKQSRFAFEIGLDASKLMEAFNQGVLNTRVSSLKLDTGGKLETAGPRPVSLSALQVQVGLFGDGLQLSGGFRNGISPYPLPGPGGPGGDSSRVMAQSPALPDLYANQRDVRFMVLLDVPKLVQYFSPSAPSGPERLQRAAVDGRTVMAPTAYAAVQSTLASAGTPLDKGTRGFMESRFGHDFGQVRIHAGNGAAASARAVHARAYTLGRDIVFGANQYAPTTSEGRRLLAHELAHVVQQRAAPQQARLMRKPEASSPAQQHFYYESTEFGGRFDAAVDTRNHRVRLIMRLKLTDMGPPQDKAERIARFSARAQAVIESTWSGIYALQSACHGGHEKFEAQVLVVFTSKAPHREINLWPDKGERSKSTEWQENDTAMKERQSPVLIDPKKPPSEKNLRMATFRQTTVAHEFGHLMGLSHVVCDGSAERCYGITAEQKTDIMGYGSVVSKRDYAPFVRIMERYGQDNLPGTCNSWRLVEPG